MCWMLCSSIHSYRLLKMGIVEKGGNVVQAKSGKFMQTVGTIMGLGENVPVIDKGCGVLSKIASFYVGEEEGATVDKIVVSVKHLWP